MESQENPFAKETPSETEAVAKQHQTQTATDETVGSNGVTERVTAQEKQIKNPKKVAAGKAGAVAKKVKQEKILKELRAAKGSFHPPAGEAEEETLVHAGKQRAPLDATRGDWTPWIIGACLAGGILIYTQLPARAKLTQTEPNPSAPLSATSRQQPVVANGVGKQLDKRDPFHME